MYRQIAEDLRAQIESGQLEPGQQLRTELELRDHYQASRNTIRDAIKWLMNLGLVETRPGQGTFVVRRIDPFVTNIGLDTVSPDLTENPVYLGEVHAANRRPSVTAPQVEVQQASEQIRDGLRIGEGSQVVARHQRRLIDGEPWSVQASFYPMEFVRLGADRLIMAEDIPGGELAYLQQTLNLRQVGWRDTIAVRYPDASEAHFFGVPEDGRVPVFEFLRVGYDANGTPIRVTVTVYPTDRNAFVVSPTAADVGSRAPAEGRQDAGSPAEVPLADQAESEARIALAQLAFDEAAALLGRAIALDPGRAARLQPDLYCLAERPGDSPGRLAWRRGLWLALAAGSPLQPPEPEPAHDDTVQAPPAAPAIATAPVPGPEDQPRPSRKPQRVGEDLEVAFVRLMERFFSLTADDETGIVRQLRLRRQSAGTQFGHDVQFDCATVGNRVVSCHVECKNYTRELKTSDVAEKILQTQAYWERKRIDYFLILTPLAGISNDLDHFIQTANSRGDLPFRIQVWSPAEGIKEFFAIEPSAYRAVYGTEPPPVPDVAAVVARWADKLRPVLRLPTPLKDYLTNARMHSLSGEDHAHFNALVGQPIEVDAVDQAGSPLGRLSDVLARWIDDPTRRRFLLLGEFGDGKSFACYRLIRFLAGRYLDNPSGYFPLRLPLRDLVKAGNPQELLSRRLQTLGAGMPAWARVQDISPTLVVLDGFDEMSAQLDHDTVRNNLNLLGECVEYFSESKILVTSRTHFFESTRVQARFLEKTENPVVARLAPLSLRKRLEHLHTYADQHGMSEKFDRIRRLYDPIGLAGKPLFLQMIKETLPNLPDDYFDEIVLYETSVRDSLRRKVGLLENQRTDTLQSETIEGMMELLESVAVRLLENGGQPIDLRTFSEGRSGIARRLWNMTKEDVGTEQAEDATARLGMRSLLKPFPVPGQEDAWLVTFCHRSMSEYFVAQALMRALHHDREMARKLLSSVILRPEIVDFAALLVNKAEDTADVARTLGEFARSARRRSKARYLGGNAITLAYRSQHKPADHRWAGLDLCYADLSGADLARADFSHSLLRFATLDNADLSGADLTGCDLTGVRLEETAPVIHTAPGGAGDGVVACYGDGTIREWRLDGSRPVTRTLLAGLADLKCAAWGPWGDLIVVDGPELSLWNIPEDDPTQSEAFRIRSGIEHVRFVGGAVCFTRTDEHHVVAMSVDCQAATVSASVRLTQPGPVVFAGNQTALIALAETVTLAHLDEGNSVPVKVAAADVTALDVRCEDPASLQLIVADSKGRVTTLQVRAGEPGPLAVKQLHEGPALCAAFLPQGLITTGGMDRSLMISDWDSGQLRVLHRIKLTLRCAGIKTAGVQGDHERQLLETLRDRAEAGVPHV